MIGIVDFDVLSEMIPIYPKKKYRDYNVISLGNLDLFCSISLECQLFNCTMQIKIKINKGILQLETSRKRPLISII